MEGILWKWTNYWNGFQPRWFVLDNGVLAYYKSQEEVNQGCKGSIKMSVCEIIVVNSVDNTRLDLVIPSEQHFYLKAATPQERQQWLVALGSAKATLSTRQKKETGNTNPDMLKTKKSELRLYCDLLMQQVHTVKSAAMEQSPNPETLTDATSLLGATCDTFIKTLEDCMKLANANFPFELPHQLITDSALPPSMAHSNALRKSKNTQINRSTSVDRSNIPNVHIQSFKSHYSNEDQLQSHAVPPRLSKEEHNTTMIQNSNSSYYVIDSPFATEGPSTSFQHVERRPSLASSEEETWADTSDNENNNQNRKEGEDRLQEESEEVANEVKLNTFFSNLKTSFLNIQITDDNGIPTKHFLDSCAIVITIFEMFGSPIFAPMRMDVMGNLKKITEKYNMNTKKFATLQEIVRYEMKTNTTTARNSATDALLWLKRGLEFVYEFLLEFSRGNPDLKHCALNAYNRTLKQYHGWIVRGVISAATHTVPSRHEVLLKLALDPNDIHNPLYEEQIKDDARRYIKAMDNIIKILNEYYISQNLDKKEVV